MAAPINSFEVVESIRFFAQLVATEGITEEIKGKANAYILRLMNTLESSVNKTVADAAGLKIVGNEDIFS